MLPIALAIKLHVMQDSHLQFATKNPTQKIHDTYSFAVHKVESLLPPMMMTRFAMKIVIRSAAEAQPK